MSELDQLARPLRDLRISVIDRCNYRCPYCMPVETFGGPSVFLKKQEWLSPAELARIASVFAELGVSKLRLTGGEPLLRNDLPEIIERLGRIDGIRDIALTTNGELLSERVQTLKQAGLQRITISLDALAPDTFAKMSGGFGHVERVLEGIAAARAAGLAPIKVNCAVLRGCNEDQILPLIAHFRGTGVVIRFIEYMDVGTCNNWRRDQVVASAEIRALIESVYPLVSLDPDYRGEVASRYRLIDGSGEIGFISSITQPFCGDCTRARLSANGHLYTCLFSNLGRDLRPALQQADDSDLRAEIQRIWSARADRYSELRAERERAARQRVEMFHIGG